MTQPNPQPTPAAPDQNQNQPQAPATGPTATPQFVQPALPQQPPATPAPAAATDDDRAAELLAAAVQQDAGDPSQLGDAGKRAIAAERERAKAAEKLAAEQAKQMAELQKQLQALQPAADVFAQLRKAAVPEAEKTDAEKLQERIAAMEQRAAVADRRALVLEVIGDLGLTKDWAEWLRGDTREELVASAEKLRALMPQPQPALDPQSTPTNGQQPAPPAAAAPVTPPAAPQPDPTQGARGPVDLNQAIQDALAKGDVRTSIALKQQLAAQSRNR